MNLRRHLRLIALAGVALWTAGLPVSLHAQGALAEAQVPARYAEAVEFARILMTAVMEESGTPGMSVAVGIDGRVVWSEGFGYADVEHRVPVWEETKFRIGSVSKPVTAAALGLLLEQGKIDLDAPVQRYVPSFPEKRWPITTRLIAGHLSGIRHYRGDEMRSSRRYATVLDGLEIFQDDTLLFEPGTRYSYSSYGWNLISAVIEGASGQEFLPYMQKNVFDALGMVHTAPEHTDSIIPHRTRYYERTRDGHVLNAPFVDNSYKWAGGGFISTPEDLVRFGFAHLGSEFLKRETIEELWTPQATSNGRSTGYGIGWGAALEDGQFTRASHGGGSVGGTTSFITYPQDNAVIAVVGNMSQAPTGGSLPILIVNAFLEPGTLSSAVGASGIDIAGDYDCVASAGGTDVSRGTLVLGGVPGDYWGRAEWTTIENESVSRSRIIASYSYEDRTRIVTVSQNAGLTSIWLMGDGDELSGTWVSGGSGELTCERQ
ncbi:MAG: beta-lactamase family protein [Gemmatimonadota bacterium]|nr:MAG: beta-lactamase family protein [Gemmatimonadota bacterium]